MTLAVPPTDKDLVLDTNILIRAVLGTRVFVLLETYADRIHFVAPELAFEQANARLPEILARRRWTAAAAARLQSEAVRRLSGKVTGVQPRRYSYYEAAAQERLARCDVSDWPFLALSLALGCPLWTEDRDFFGTGVATWTTDLVEIYLRSG